MKVTVLTIRSLLRRYVMRYTSYTLSQINGISTSKYIKAYYPSFLRLTQKPNTKMEGNNKAHNKIVQEILDCRQTIIYENKEGRRASSIVNQRYVNEHMTA